MKKPIVIFFLAVFCLNQTGHYIFYAIEKWQVQNRIKEQVISGIPDQYLEIIQCNKDIEWEEEGKEFTYKGEWYDVARIKIINGITLLFCVNDKNEERLIKHFARTTNPSTDHQKGKNSKHSFKFQLMDQIFTGLVSPVRVADTGLLQYCGYASMLASLSREIIIPPPWNPLI